MSEDEKAALKGWKEYHKDIKKYNLDKIPECPNPIDRMYDGYFTGFYAGRDYQKNKPFDKKESIAASVKKVLRRKGSSKAAKTARGSALSQRR